MNKCDTGESGVRFSSALIRSVFAWVDEAAEEIPYIVIFSGNNYTVSEIRSALVL